MPQVVTPTQRGVARHGADDGSVVGGLRRKRLQVGGQADSEVEFGDRDVDAERGERLHDRLHVRRRRPSDEMRLQADAVDRFARAFERCDKIVERPHFRTLGLDVVVVDVELGPRVSGPGRPQRDRDIVRPHRVVPDRFAPVAVVGEGLVDDVPGVNCAFVPACLGGDMGDHEVLEFVRLKRAVDEPGRQLRMPDEGVAANLLAIGLGESDERVSRPPIERPAQRFDEAPFHLVLRRDAGQLRRRQAAIGPLVEIGGIEGGAEIAAARRRRGAKRRLSR